MLRFVVALEAEARPLVERYRLQRDVSASAFKIYARDDTALVVSGVGKVSAAAATSFLHLATGGERHAAWINVGVAGHGRLSVGTAVLAHKVRDRATGRAWYPPQVFEPKVFPPTLTGDQVTTVDSPERGFAEPGAFDMEASGFYATACRFASAEAVHCLKVVSDGPGAEPEKLTAAEVRRLVAGQLSTVEALVEQCGRLSRELRRLERDPPDLAECLGRWHFSVTERRELRRQLRRRQALAPEMRLPLDGVGERVRGKEINRRLRGWLDALPPG